MQIITGVARGCSLETLDGEGTRPTGARVKHGVFSVLQFDITGRRVLDLFAGSGQMGLEALSRGAESCVFVEKNPRAYKIVQRNLAAAAVFDDTFSKNARLIQMDALNYLNSVSENDKFDLVFLDPPFNSDVFEEATVKIQGVLNSGGIVVCERQFAGAGLFSPKIGTLNLRKEYKYGRVKVGIYCLQ